MPIIEELRKGLFSRSEEETRDIACRLADALPAEAVLALDGDLGVGKSTFVRGLAQAWAITQPLTSPTFNLFYTYPGKRQLIHLDAYRLHSAADAENLLLEDLLRPPFCLVVEWPGNIDGYLPPDTLWLRFSITEAHPEAHTLRIELLSAQE